VTESAADFLKAPGRTAKDLRDEHIFRMTRTTHALQDCHRKLILALASALKEEMNASLFDRIVRRTPAGLTQHEKTLARLIKADIKGIACVDAARHVHDGRRHESEQIEDRPHTGSK